MVECHIRLPQRPHTAPSQRAHQNVTPAHESDRRGLHRYDSNQTSYIRQKLFTYIRRLLEIYTFFRIFLPRRCLRHVAAALILFERLHHYWLNHADYSAHALSRPQCSMQTVARHKMRGDVRRTPRSPAVRILLPDSRQTVRYVIAIAMRERLREGAWCSAAGNGHGGWWLVH